MSMSMIDVFRRSLRLAPFAAALALPSLAQAQLSPDWSASVAAQVPAPALAVDAGRNTVLAATLPGQPVTVTKLGPTGTQLWQRSLGGAASRAFDVVTDSTGGIVLAGAVLDANGLPAGTLVARLDAAGNPQWQDLGSTTAQARELALDASGNVYALVQAGNASTGTDVQLVKFSAAGVRQWTRSIGAPLVSAADALVVNSNGQPVVSGTNGAGQAVVAAFDAQGNPLASIQTGTTALSLAAGHSGEVYAVGGGSGLLAIKYGPAFNEVWRRTATTSGAALRAVVDATGGLVMTGSFTVAGSAGGFGGAVLTTNWRTVRLDPAGATLWSADFGYPHFTMGPPAALAVGIDGSVLVTGRSAEPITTSTGTVGYGQSMTTLRYTPAGTLGGTHYVSASPGGVDLEVASDGGVHVVGEANVLTGASAPVLHFAAPVLAPARPTALFVAGPVWESSRATMTVNVSTAAGATVKLTSSNTGVAKVPASVVVPAGATSATFVVTTGAVRRNTAVTIRASANGTTLGTSITVLNR
jgi:hypothetical protein